MERRAWVRMGALLLVVAMLASAGTALAAPPREPAAGGASRLVNLLILWMEEGWGRLAPAFGRDWGPEKAGIHIDPDGAAGSSSLNAGSDMDPDGAAGGSSLNAGIDIDPFG